MSKLDSKGLDSLRTNFLKIQLFNLEQKLKLNAKNRVNEIKEILEFIEELEKRIKKKNTPKDNLINSLNKYRYNLLEIQKSETDLFNFIDYIYKFGRYNQGVFIATAPNSKELIEKFKETLKEKPKPKIIKKTRIKKS